MMQCSTCLHVTLVDHLRYFSTSHCYSGGVKKDWKKDLCIEILAILQIEVLIIRLRQELSKYAIQQHFYSNISSQSLESL